MTCLRARAQRLPVQRICGSWSSALFVALAQAPALAQTGTLIGRVTNALTGAPVASAQVTITGTPLGVSAGADGAFRIANVPTSAREAVGRSIGYKPAAIAFVIGANDTVRVSLSMMARSLELDAIVVTGSAGDARRRATGNSVAVIDARSSVDQSAVANLTELLQAKAPGVTIAPTSGTVGTAASYRLRGAGSLSAANSPTIYVDGVRVSSRDQGSYNVFGQSTTALDAINPADIESIEIIRGPSAATLYGAEAAPGVIQILTKKGRAGRIRWESRVEAGRSDWDDNLRPTNFAVATAARLSDTANWPSFAGKQLGDVVSFRPLSDGRALRTAGLSKLVLSASGGADRYTFFVSAGAANEQGVFFNNYSNLRSARGNFVFVPATSLTFSTNIALSRNHVRLPINDNAGPMGLIASSYLAVPGRKYGFPGGLGYTTITPEIANTYDNQTWADRYTVGVGAEFIPVTWFKSAVRIGLDANVGTAELFFAPDSRTPAPFLARASLALDNTKGLIAQGRPLSRDVTVDYQGSVTRRVSKRFVSTASFGLQYLANDFRRTDAIGVDLGSGQLRSIAAAAVRTSAESSSEQKSFGFYVQQQASFDDRFFVTLATRVDNNSAFGAKLNRVLYPKASISYVLSDEPFFKIPGISALRLRGAWGQAGNTPGPFDAARSYTSSVVTYSTGSTSALRYGSAGNPGLRPERGTELELGFEAAFFDDRIRWDVSRYDKTTHDALIPVPIPASTGFSGNQLVNLGEISNTGFEMTVRAIPLQRTWLTIDAAVSLSTNHNTLVSFGDDRGPMLFGFNALSQRYQVGLPLGAFWARRMQYNSDGTLLQVDGRPVLDTVDVYRGPSVPTRQVALSGGMLLFGRLRVHGLAEYQGGHFQFDVTDWRRDRDSVSWETVNPLADRDEVLTRKSALSTFLQIQEADFVKLRDLSVSYDLPQQLRRGVASRATLTLAGHNLKIWSRYRGADPELNSSGPSRFNRDDLWTVPQTRRYSAAIALAF